MHASRPWRWGVWSGYLICLVTLTHLPPRRLPGWGFAGIDKVVHFALYVILGFVTAWAAGKPGRTTSADRVAGGVNSRPGGQVRLWLAWLAVLWLVAAADEATQPWVGRHADVSDWMADGFGCVVGLWLGVRRRLSRREEQKEERLEVEDGVQHDRGR